MKAFESAFDPQWREDYRNLYRLAGMDLAVEDVGHFHEPSFRAGLQHTARAGFVYDKIKADARRVSGWTTWMQPGGTKRSPYSCTSMAPTGSP